MSGFDQHVLSNGMVVLGESMAEVKSVAFGFRLPCGSATLPDGCAGSGEVISDWIFRGAGGRNSKQLVEALDHLGLQRSTSVTSAHLSLGGALECENLDAALDLYADVILTPALQPAEFANARLLAMEAVYALEDDPRQKVMLDLRQNFYPDPFGRSALGNIEELNSLSCEQAQAIIDANFDIPATIFSVAGNYDFDAVCEKLEALFGSSKPKARSEITTKQTGKKYDHIANEGAQVHIGLMTPTVGAADPEYYNARAAVSILSGGMSSRLFTEVREKRGLCYAVGASYHCLKEAAGIACYVGTTPEKAQETYDVILREFDRLAEGITHDELERAKTGLKSALVLNSESSGSRAASIAADYFMLGRIRSLDEIKECIDATTVDSVVNFLKANPFKKYTVVTIGPEQIKLRK